MNRILPFLSCPCCHELRQIERQLDAAALQAERIEAITNAVEFWLPDAARVARPKPDDDEPGIRLLVSIEPPLADIDADLVAFTIEALRRMAADMLEAAAAIEGGVR